MKDFDAWEAKELSSLNSALANKRLEVIKPLTREEWEKKGEGKGDWMVLRLLAIQSTRPAYNGRSADKDTTYDERAECVSHTFLRSVYDG